MKNLKVKTLLLIPAVLIAIAGFTQTAKVNNTITKESKKTTAMNTYVIEREIPGAGSLTGADLKSISQKSCGVLKELGPEIEWVQSYVTTNKIYCIYRAENEEILKVHAEKGGFPINSISLLSTMISPATAELPMDK